MFQKKYIGDVLLKFGMQDSQPIVTPLDINSKLPKTIQSKFGNSSLVNRKSYTGCVFKATSAAIALNARKQTTVCLSSTEAEYMALSEAAKVAVRSQCFLTEVGLIHTHLDAKPTKIFCNEQKV